MHSATIFTNPPGASYTISVIARVGSDVRFSSYEVYINVIQGEIIALINGGNHITSTKNEKIVLDASTSMDTDNIPHTNSNAFLNYKWSCRIQGLNNKSCVESPFKLYLPDDFIYQSKSVRSTAAHGALCIVPAELRR